MKASFWRALLIAPLFFLGLHQLEAQVVNGVLRQVYEGVPGVTLPELTNLPQYPDEPTTETIQLIFEAPSSYGDNYGTRMTAYVVPPVTGDYTFWIATDDNGALFLSTDESPANKVEIARVNSWTSAREWDKEPNQQSAPIRLEAGQRYFIEALQKEGGGGDNLAVRWRLPDGTIEEPIPNERLHVYGLDIPIISSQPMATSALEGGSATFDVEVVRKVGLRYQWLRDGVPIPGATNSSYYLSPVFLADQGTLFQVELVNSVGSILSDEAELTVIPDATPPEISAVGNLGDLRNLFVVFSEPVGLDGATNVLNYVLDGGVTVERVELREDGRTVVLTTSLMEQGRLYQLSISGVQDRAVTPNIILPGTVAEFSIEIDPIDYSFLFLQRESLGPSSRAHGVVISEVMYHPADREDGRNVEYLEVYNSQPWFEELGGWRISGAIDYIFPEGTILQSGSYLVVAANPADVEEVYGVTGVMGPFLGGGALQNDSGTLRLRNASDAVHFEMNYSGEDPFPLGADGGGHSLVLARPSYGERDVRAWDLSSRIGGSPGVVEPPLSNPWRSVRINEFLAHSDPPDVDFIELYNYRKGRVNLSGATLSDELGTNKYVFPANTLIQAQEYLLLTEDDLGFRLSSAGEQIVFRTAGGQIIETLQFDGQENGVSSGRSPDGAPMVNRLQEPTPGAPNSLARLEDIVISEIMFDPASSDSNDEFIELHNRSDATVNLGGWRLRDGIRFDFPEDTLLAAGAYLVVGSDAERLQANYPALDELNCLGNFSGRLSNQGERIELNKPDTVVSTNAVGVLETNIIRITVDEVTYGQGGRWGRWANGGGSSLELKDVRSDGRRASNWASSDESQKSPWVVVEATGVMDNGHSSAHQLHITLQGEGEMLIDDVELIPAGQGNVIANADFDSGVEGWVFQGNHNESSWSSNGGTENSGAMHIRTTGRGDTGSNRIRTQLPSPLSPGTIVTLRARARWLKGDPNLLLRIRGNYMEAIGYTLPVSNLGTPGEQNSHWTPNAAPSITGTRHFPVLPAANQSVTVMAQVDDPDGLAFLTLNFRMDPSTNYMAIAMTNNGAGLYSAAIPGQPDGEMAAFFIEAADNGVPSATSFFPSDAPERECLVRWGDTATPGTLGIYRMWISDRVIQEWDFEEKMSNKPKDVTFIYNSERIIYNAGSFFHGSPFHSPAYNSPVGNSCDYDFRFPVDDRLLGETDINLFRPGNGGGDSSGQREIHGYWYGHQFGVPYLYHRPVFVYANGQRRQTIYHDAQQPNGDFIRQWYPDDSDGKLHKIKLGFEFGDQAYGNGEQGFSLVGANLREYRSGGEWKVARYRETWPLRSVSPTGINDYTNIFELVEAVNTSSPIGSEAYTDVLRAATDVEEWYSVHVVQHLINNRDSFSYGGGQNAFAYMPERHPWQLFLWDIDFAFSGTATDGNLTSIGGADHGPRNNHPTFGRLYWQLLLEAANGMTTPERSNAIIDARYNGLQAAGANVANPQPIKDFIAARRQVVLDQAAANQSTFAITSNGGNDFQVSSNLVRLTGTAPLEVADLKVNGVSYPVHWTSLSSWELSVPVDAGVNSLVFTGNDRSGNTVAGVSGSIEVTFNGVSELPEDHISITELMFESSVDGGNYVELYNSSSESVFDLSGWRLNGVDFVFPPGSVIAPGRYVVVAESASVIQSTYGASIDVVGEYDGRLDPQGERLTLLKPGVIPEEEIVVDQVRYDNQFPWPQGDESFLQVIDVARDNARASNWAGGAGWQFFSFTGRIGGTRMFLFLDQAGEGYVDSINVVTGDVAGAGVNLMVNGDFEEPLEVGWTGTGGHSGSQITTDVAFSGNSSLRLVSTDTGGSSSAVIQNQPLIDRDGTYTMSFWYLPVPTPVNLTARFGSLFRPVIDMGVIDPTPGGENSVAAVLPVYPELWLNEIQIFNQTGISDGAGEREPWVEIYNSGDSSISLDGMFLSPLTTELGIWMFPDGRSIDPGDYEIVWLDGDPGQTSPTELHAGFTVTNSSGQLVLSRVIGGSHQVLDYLEYDFLGVDQSRGAVPNGQLFDRNVFLPATPGEPNVFPIVNVLFNEWMAVNDTTLADPADDDFEDWFELYNAGPTLADLSGFYLSDDLLNPRQWRIPSGVVLLPGQVQLIWADDETGQNDVGRSRLHAGFRLAQEGEDLVLSSPAGDLIDVITFSAQGTDVSEGRLPDGSANIDLLSVSTPGESNRAGAPIHVWIERFGASVVIHYQTVAGLTYLVQSTDSLSGEGWQAVGGSRLATGEEDSIMQVIELGARYYRVVRVAE